MLAQAQTQCSSGFSSLYKRRVAAIGLCTKEKDLKPKSTSSITENTKAQQDTPVGPGVAAGAPLIQQHVIV